jgi:hypothetical protein
MGWSLLQRSPTMCLNTITKPPVWGGQGPYKDCRATDNDDDYIITSKAILGYSHVTNIIVLGTKPEESRHQHHYLRHHQDCDRHHYYVLSFNAAPIHTKRRPSATCYLYLTPCYTRKGTQSPLGSKTVCKAYMRVYGASQERTRASSQLSACTARRRRKKTKWNKVIPYM